MLSAVSPGVYIGLGAALLAAILFGSGDYGAAILGKKMSPLMFTSSNYLIEIPVLFLLLLISGDHGKTSTNLSMFGLGTLGTIAFMILVFALTKGHVSVVMALAGLFAILVPAIVSIVIGENSSILVWAGFAAAAIAIVCITQARDAEDHEDAIAHAKGLKISIILGIIAGVLTGVYFASLGKIDSPIFAKLFYLQLSGFIIALVYFALKRPSFESFRKYFVLMVLIALAYQFGQMLFPFATTKTSLVITTIIVNLYPGVTIMWAKIFSHEKTSRIQNAGFIVAAIGVVLVSIGAGS